MENHNPSPPTSIIIDRPDYFCIEPADGGRREWPISDALLEVLKVAKGVVKVVVVMHDAYLGVSEQISWNWGRLEKKSKQPLLVSRLNWEQGTRQDVNG